MGNVVVVLVAIVGMLMWIALWLWMALAGQQILSRRVMLFAQVIGKRTQQGVHKSLRNLWQPEYVVRGIATVLLVLAAGFFYMGMNAAETDRFATAFAPNLATDCLGLAITILVIDQLYRWRDKVYQQRINETLAAERKRNIIEQMGSLSNDFALDAVRIAMKEGWLEDGSLQGAHLMTANLEGANLIFVNLQGAFMLAANLQGAILGKANLQGARLIGAKLQRSIFEGAELQRAILRRANLQDAYLLVANLQDADLQEANLSGADLRQANLKGANLREANLKGSRYTNETIWPDGFDPAAAGAVLEASLIWLPS